MEGFVVSILNWVETIKKAYAALVRSILQYNCAVWSPFELGHLVPTGYPGQIH